MAFRGLKKIGIAALALAVAGCSILVFDGETSGGPTKYYKGLFRNQLIVGADELEWRLVDWIPKNGTVDEVFAPVGRGKEIEVGRTYPQVLSDVSQGLYATCVREINAQVP